MKIKFALKGIACLLLFRSVTLFAQTSGNAAVPPPVALPNIVQPAPEAASLGKYGDQIIGLNTGTAMAKIPLFELKTKRLSLPITLSYASNGIRVDESASRVGMGWVLNAGGVIARTVYDKPDLASHPRITAPPNLNFHPFNPQMSTATNSLYTTDPDLLTWMENNVANNPDMQYDEFNFNFNGYAGKFIFDNNNNVILLPQSNLKVEYQATGDWNFRITTPDGVRYYFGGTATDISIAATGYSAHDQYASAWYLTKVENPADSTDYITLSYGSATYGYFTGVSENITIDPIASTTYGNSSRGYSAATDNNANYSGLGTLNFKVQNLGTIGVYLQNITASHFGTIKFNYQNKPDASNGGDYLLQQIEFDLAANQPSFYYNFNYDIVAPSSAYFNLTSNAYYSTDFFSTAQSLSRPFLKTVIKSSPNTSETQTYAFEYIDKEHLPPHLSFSQDHWGYFNGASTLNSLIYPGEADYSLLGATMTNALKVNRDVNYSYAQKGMLSKITYPTGGTTQYYYEGNSSDGTTPTGTSGSDGSDTPPVLVNSINIDGNTPSMTFEVRVPTVVNLTMQISCNCPTGGCTVMPNNAVALQLVMNGTTNIASFDFTPYNQRGDCARSSGGAYTLQPGIYGVGSIPHAPYTITATLSNTGGTGGFWVNQSQNTPYIPPYVPLSGGFYGGVRVNSIIDTDPVTGISKTTTYHYSGLSGSYLPSYEQQIFRYGLGATSVVGSGQYTAHTEPTFPFDYAEYVQFVSGTFSNLVGRDSHTVSYTNVTEQFGSNGENGGIDHTYSYNVNNSALITPYGGHFLQNLSPPEYFWRNGLEQTRYTYKLVNGSKVSVQNTINTYSTDDRISNSYEQFSIVKNGGNIIDCSYPDIAYTVSNNLVGCSPAFFSDAFGLNKRESVFDIYSITNKQEWLYLSQTQTTNYDLNGQNPVITTENFYYDNPAHVQLTRKVTTNSDGKVFTSLTTYPNDYSAGTQFIDDMKANHLTGLPIETVNYETSGTDIKILSGKIDQYQNGGAGLIAQQYFLETPLPISQASFKFSNSLAGTIPLTGTAGTYAYDTRYYKSRVSFLYDNTGGDLIQANLTSGPAIAYQWGYGNQYPVAKVNNALSKNIFYDSFEEGDGNGTKDNAKTGHYSYTGNYNKALSGFDNGNYILSYWSKSGSSWTFNTTTVTVTGGAYTIALSGQIDDVRFYPSNAQMTTYTYDPLIGMTSSTDAKGEITTYEYDSFQRLKTIRDKDGNILKDYCYNYAGQQTGCPISIAPGGLPYIAMTTASSTVDGNGHTQNTYTFTAYADAGYTTPYTLTSNLTINYKETTTVTHSGGSPPPQTTNTSYTITLPAGSNHVTTTQYDMAYCPGSSQQAAAKTQTTNATASPNNIQPGDQVCTQSYMTLLNGTGYQTGGGVQ